MFEFEFELSVKDYVRFNTYNQSQNPFFRKKNLASRIGIPLILLVILILAIFSGLSIGKTIIMAIVFFIISLIYNMFFKIINGNILARQVKEMGRDGFSPFAKHSILRFEEDFYTEITPDEENSVDYSRIEIIVEDGGLIYLYLSALTANIIPVSAFEANEQKEKFLDFLESKTGIQRVFA